MVAFSSVFAADPPSELDFFEPIPTISLATRLPGSALDVPAAVTVIDRALIEASTATTIPDLLRLVPGFQVAHATGAQFTATRHGVSDQLERRMEVLVNGNSVYLPSNSSVDWNLVGVALEDIDRIEVVRSPNAPALGSNAMFGSINIITRKPIELAGGYLRVTGGSLETAIGVARAGGRIGPMDAVATFQYSEDDGFDRVDDHKRINNLRLHGTMDLDPINTLDIEIGYSEGETGADGAGVPSDPFRDFRLQDAYQAITWRSAQPDEQGSHRLAFVHRVTTQDDGYRYFVTPDLFIPLGFLDTTTERFDLELEQALKPSANSRFLWGAGVRYDTIQSDLYLRRYGGEVDVWSGRVLAAAEWRPVQSLLLTVNALTEFTELADTYTSPRIGLNWRFAENQALRVSASRNYKTFSPGEQLGDYAMVLSDGTLLRQLVRSTGPGLPAEQLTDFELGYRLESAAHRLHFDITLFHEELRNGWSGARDPNRTTVWSADNGHWNTNGVEAEVRWKPDRETLIFGSYAYAKTDGSEFTRIDAEGRPIAWASFDDTTPRHTLALQLSREFLPSWQGSLALFHVSDMRWLGEGGEVDAYTRLDAKIAKSFKLRDTDVEVAFFAQNLTNSGYYEFRPEFVYDNAGNLFERRFFLQVSASFPSLFR